MKADLIDKKSGSRRQVENGQQISPDRPSVIVLKLAPEKVARYERRGDDLVLVLKDGQEIAITGFFLTYPAADGDRQESADGSEAEAREAGRNELVLEDDNGVAWWGQYPEQWSEFHFTEIELHDVGGFSWWPMLLGVLGGAGAIAAVAGGGGGGSDDGDTGAPPAAAADAAGGKEDGGPVTGNVLTNDSDPDKDPLTVSSFSINGTSYKAGDEVSIAGVGTFTLRANGTYTFTPVANWNGTVPTVTYTVSDGEGGTDTANLVLTVDPVTDLVAVDDSATTNEASIKFQSSRIKSKVLWRSSARSDAPLRKPVQLCPWARSAWQTNSSTFSSSSTTAICIRRFPALILAVRVGAGGRAPQTRSGRGGRNAVWHTRWSARRLGDEVTSACRGRSCNRSQA